MHIPIVGMLGSHDYRFSIVVTCQQQKSPTRAISGKKKKALILVNYKTSCSFARSAALVNKILKGKPQFGSTGTHMTELINEYYDIIATQN